MATLYSHSLPFQLEFSVPPARPLQVLSFWTQMSDVLKDDFLEIRENVALRLRFIPQDQAESIGQIEIETSIYNELGDMEPFIIPLSGEFPYELYRNRWSDNRDTVEQERAYPWRMGYYLIRVVYNDQIYFTGIKVIPNNMTSDQVKRLQTYLENQVEGISHDLILSQQGFTNETFDTPDYMNYILFLFDFRMEIMSLLQQILANPIEEMKTVYKVSSQSGRQTTVSERWIQTAKGMGYNGGFLPQPFSLNAKKELHLNNSMNQWIKYVMIQWRNNIDGVTRLVSDDVERLKKQEEQQRHLMILAKEEIERTQRERDMHLLQQKQYRSAFLRAEARLKQINQQQSICRERIKVLDNLSSQMSYVIVQPTFDGVSMPIGKPVLKNRAYYRLNYLYELSKQYRQEEGGQRRYKPVLKRTWQLYEYFVLMQIIDAIRSEGFDFKGGFGQQELTSYLEQGIAEGSRYILESKQATIHIWYDKMLPLTIEDAQRTGEDFYLPSEHRKPDIRLDFYKKLDNGDLQFWGCFIVEVKDSKFRNLYSHNFNRIRSQLSAYRSIYYCGSHIGGNMELKMAPVVKRVFCIHAGEAEGKEGQEALIIRFPHEFLRLCPVFDERDEISVFGYSELTKALATWVERGLTESGREF